MKNKVQTKKNSCVVCGNNVSKVVCTGTDYQYSTTKQLFNWKKCNACDHHYIDPIPSVASLSIIYPRALGNYDDFDSSPGLAFKVKAVLDGTRIKKLSKHVHKNGRLLDIGCASGAILDIAKAYCTNFNVFEGLDISKTAARISIKKGYKVYISTAELASLPDNYYDLILMFQVIEHLHNPNAVLKKLRRSLRPGGKIIIETPNLDCFDRKIFGGFWEGYHIPRHFNIWTIEGMNKTLEKAGYSSVKSSLLSKPVHWTMSLQNWAVANKKSDWIVKLFDFRSRFPILLLFFGFLDLCNKVFLKKASGIQYIAIK